MADEERIYISHYTKDVCSDCLHDHCYEGLCNCDFEYKNGITRQEAIEVMAKAIHFFEWGHNKNMPQWTELNNDIQDDYKNMAKAALNALLGVEK